MKADEWRRWGPYISARQWGTVREDYSATGEAWEYLPFDHSGKRAYRWGEDGIFGISDTLQRLCFAPAFWNGNDDRLKERFFGLTGNQGNHGEDVKEYYFFLDNTPRHDYMRALYKYPHAAFPYAQILNENAKRTRHDPEYELLDTGVFDDDRYFDIEVEYAKGHADDLLVRITATNRGSHPHDLHVLPTLWFRNEWAWRPGIARPAIELEEHSGGTAIIRADHAALGSYRLYARNAGTVLFTENETNFAALFGSTNPSPYVKDGIERAIVHGDASAVNPQARGTKAALHYALTLAGGQTQRIELRLTRDALPHPFASFEEIFAHRRASADAFYRHVDPYCVDEDQRAVQRQAFAGLLWSKQFYHYNVSRWLHGDPLQPPPPPQRLNGRNHEWHNFDAMEVLSVPDTWEYPWFAAWDLAFHTVAFALIDSTFAKDQLVLLTREWYMHPNGQLPAYEWAFDDVNPPVHAWAALRIYQIDQRLTGKGDIAFLERIFQKLLMNFTWWVNRKDASGNNVFQGGFLGLDNIGIFDRSKPLPGGGTLEQSDGTTWMAVYTLSMLGMSIELAKHNRVYEDTATKFFEHFLYIASAINNIGGTGLWNEDEGLYNDVLLKADGEAVPLRVRSLVGILPMLAVQTIEPQDLLGLPEFAARLEWFVKQRPDLAEQVASMKAQGAGQRRLLSIVTRERLQKMLKSLFDEAEFFSPHGIRALSRYHRDHPYSLEIDGADYSIDYEPAESRTGLFGGNSNWRGPVWFPLNYLIVEALQRYHYYYGSALKIECPTGSGNDVDLWDAASELSRRLISIFTRDAQGRRAVYGGTERFQTDPHWRDHLLFFEYFQGDDGAGLGASHQTGWTALVAKLIEQQGQYSAEGRKPSPETSTA